MTGPERDVATFAKKIEDLSKTVNDACAANVETTDSMETQAKLDSLMCELHKDPEFQYKVFKQMNTDEGNPKWNGDWLELQVSIPPSISTQSQNSVKELVNELEKVCTPNNSCPAEIAQCLDEGIHNLYRTGGIDVVKNFIHDFNTGSSPYIFTMHATDELIDYYKGDGLKNIESIWDGQIVDKNDGKLIAYQQLIFTSDDKKPK